MKHLLEWYFRDKVMSTACPPPVLWLPLGS